MSLINNILINTIFIIILVLIENVSIKIVNNSRHSCVVSGLIDYCKCMLDK